MYSEELSGFRHQLILDVRVLRVVSIRRTHRRNDLHQHSQRRDYAKAVSKRMLVVQQQSHCACTSSTSHLAYSVVHVVLMLCSKCDGLCKTEVTKQVQRIYLHSKHEMRMRLTYVGPFEKQVVN